MGEMLRLPPTEISSVYKRYRADRIPADELEELLSKPPPDIDRRNAIEVWRKNPKTGNSVRICGFETNKKLPTFVPEGIPNPHGVVNPRKEYVCCKPAGWKTDHAGVGPCWFHHTYSNPGKDGESWGKRYHLRTQFKELLKDCYLNGADMEDDVLRGRDALAVLEEGLDGGSGGASKPLSFDAYLEKVKQEVAPEDLVDSLRLLYEIEAQRAMLRDEQERLGEVDPERIEKMTNNILKMAQFQATIAKRDEHLMKAKAIQAICQVFITGVLAVVSEELDNADAIKILNRIKEEVVLPVNERGYTEMLRRQEAAGLTKVAEDIAIEAEYQELDEEEEF